MHEHTRNRIPAAVSATLAGAALLFAGACEVAAPAPGMNQGYPAQGAPQQQYQQPQAHPIRDLFASTIAAVLQTTSMGIASGISGGIVNWFAAKTAQKANQGYASGGQYPNAGYGYPNAAGASSPYPATASTYPSTTYPSSSYPSSSDPNSAYPNSTYPNPSGSYPSSSGYPNSGTQYPSSGYPTNSYPSTASGYPNSSQQYPSSGYPSTGTYPDNSGYPNNTSQYPSSSYPNSTAQTPNSGYPTAGTDPNSSYPPTGTYPDNSGYPNSQYPSSSYPNSTAQTPNSGYPTASTYPNSSYPPTNQYPSSSYPPTAQYPNQGYPSSGTTDAYGASNGPMVAVRETGDSGVYAGIAYEVHALSSDGHWVPIDPMTYQFRSGDRFMVYYRPSLPGRMQVFNINPAGQQTLIDATNMAAGQLAGLGPYEFTNLAGDESLRLVLAPCSTPQLLVATRDIVKVDAPPPSDAQTGGGVHLENCSVTTTRSVAVRTRDIQKVAADGTTSYALDPVSAQELTTGNVESREVTIVFHHT